MIGVSIYLSKKRVEKQEEWLKVAKENGFSSIFTSLHIPEDDPNTYKELIQILGKQALENEMELMVDVSPKSLHHLGISYENVEELLEWGITGLRMDYGITPKEIASVSHKMQVALNASTITEPFWKELLAENIRVDRVEAWHNFYPRPETGLAKSFLQKQNQYLHECGIKTMAFIPGDREKRGPLYEGLPTLEKHRNMRPLEAYLELVQECNVDKVLIGDISGSLESVQEIAIASNGIIPVRYQSFINDSEVLKVVEQVHTNRLDPARDVIRSVESREGNKVVLQPMHTIARKRGSITIDNELYGRYAGEMQVVVHDLPVDEKVNVVGMVVEEDVSLLSYIGAGKNFQLFLSNRMKA
ncbi:cell surface protein [Bacillus cereus]|uniref:Cell surface protein n=1 Tax=Bacillus cereus TaxID=1396 RepID=A0A2A8LKZ5_BACCE|nr:MupG family TIM beta-alpha barrel fold protein [Bacillus cereus]MDR4986046.1 MupG family TIM beta-alpha barrel fold protein [Bacillus cereus]PES94137.1 cell surface protein [Bacillus cereus]PFP77193.1 cell surface protein [Bacillus cereus]PGT14865.1 cell surface protein [Bacillus cereus]